MTPAVLAKVSQSVDPNRAIRVYRADLYPKQFWWFLACFIATLTAVQFGALLVAHKRRRRLLRLSQSSKGENSATVEEQARSTVNTRVSLRRIPLAVVNSFRIVSYRITLPIGGGNVLNGAELGVTAGYIIAIFTWEFIRCNNVTTGVKLDPAYWANRAGNIAASQLPMVIALSGKNNLISVLTGISYEKLNVLHRASARVLLVMIWVHFWGRFKQGLKTSLALTNPWIRAGVMVATAYTLLVLISFRPFRTRYYEFFFFSHMILVLIILIGAYYHIRVGEGNYLYLVPSFVLWAFDRTFRAFRVFWNDRSLSSSSEDPVSLSAKAVALSPTMVRLSFVRNMTWQAGQSVLITMPGVSNFPLEAHPFTIANIPQGLSLRDAGSAQSSKEEIPDNVISEEGNELTFLIRVKEGFTKRLRTVAEGDGALPLSVYVDGPYGSPPDMNAFEKVILIAGGSGVSYTLPLLQDIVYNARRGTSGCRNILFFWTVAHRGDLSWISQSLYEAIRAAPKSISIRIRLHVTRDKYVDGDASSRQSSSDEKTPIDSEVDELLHDRQVKLEYGRVDAIVALQEELVDVQGSVSVDVAGPSDLAADVRTALSYGNAGPASVLKGGPDVTLHIETYGIA